MTHNSPLTEWTAPEVDARIVVLKRTAREDALAQVELDALQARHARELWTQWWITPRGSGWVHAKQRCPSRPQDSSPLSLLYPCSGLELDEVVQRLGDVLCPDCVGEHSGTRISRAQACERFGLEYGQPASGVRQLGQEGVVP